MHSVLAVGGKFAPDLGLLVGVLGGLCIAWAKAGWLANTESAEGRYKERVRTMIGALLIAVAFLLLFIGRL